MPNLRRVGFRLPVSSRERIDLDGVGRLKLTLQWTPVSGLKLLPQMKLFLDTRNSTMTTPNIVKPAQ